MHKDSRIGAGLGILLGGAIAGLGLLGGLVFLGGTGPIFLLFAPVALAAVSVSALATARTVEQRARDPSRRLGMRMEALEATLGELKGLADGSIEIGEDVEAATHRAASLSGEVGRAIERDKDSVAALDAQIALCRDGVATVKAGLDELAGAVMEDQSSSLSQSTAAIEEIVASVKAISSLADSRARGTVGLVELVEAGTVHMGASLSGIRELVQSAQGLIDIVRVIEDVAQRVDLLAMNAAIEAAHAREAGKGFAVVADEVRKLAVATDSQAKDISARLKAMIGLMRQAERSTEETDQSFRRVIESARDAATGMTEISGGMREMAQGGSEILDAVQNLTEVTGRVRQLSDGTREGAAGVDRAIAAIAGLSRDNLVSAQAMGDLVGEMDRTFALLLDQGKANASKIAEMDASLARSGARRSSATIVVGYNEVPPFSMATGPGSPPGAANAFLASALEDLGLRVGFRKVQALERLYELLDRGDIDAYALATRSYGPRPDLAYRVPPTPFLTPRPGLLVRADSPVARPGARLSGLAILTKTGMPTTPSLAASGARLEYLGGASPLLEGLGLVAQGRADGVYSVIAAELSYMAKEAGLLGKLTTVYLPDPPIELFVAISPSSSIDLSRFEACQKSLLARRPMASFLEPYLGPGASL